MTQPHLVLFENADFHGRHKHILNTQFLDNTDFNKITSSIIIFEGRWIFDAEGNPPPLPTPVGPGLYRFVEDIGIPNDSIFAVRLHRDELPKPPLPHLILFEHTDFHGRHKHVSNFQNLHASDDSDFNKITSSITILEGGWNFYDQDGRQLGGMLVPGLYPFVSNAGIQNDAISFVEIFTPVIVPPTQPHLILFEDAEFGGRHKHVLNTQSLHASDDSDFDKITSSMVIFAGSWVFYDQDGRPLAGGQSFGPGLYSFVGNAGIQNDAISFIELINAEGVS